MAGDKYGSFDELRRAERDGVDFRIRVMRREASVAIIAPHGGRIEPGTSELAEAIAGDDFSLYCFEGLGKRPHAISTSLRPIFGNRNAWNWLRSAIALWPCMAATAKIDSLSRWAGWTTALRDAICKSLQDAGFSAESRYER